MVKFVVNNCITVPGTCIFPSKSLEKLQELVPHPYAVWKSTQGPDPGKIVPYNITQNCFLTVRFYFCGWLTDCHWLIDWLIDWFSVTDRLTVGLIDLLPLVDLLIVTDWLNAFLWLIDWLSLIDWLLAIGWLTDWLTACLWLTDCEWLIDWSSVTYWLIACVCQGLAAGAAEAWRGGEEEEGEGGGGGQGETEVGHSHPLTHPPRPPHPPFPALALNGLGHQKEFKYLDKSLKI